MTWIDTFLKNSEEIIVDKKLQLKLCLSSILAGGHILIEDIPGVGKTTMVKYISKSLGLEMSRIQFTNDLLPSDILGVNIYNPQDGNFTFHKGPIFGQVILADELNRAGPKTQSALLQVMEEKKVTVDNHTFEVPEPFIVMATQNPRHQVGTNALPESQLDRFLMKIDMGYPAKSAEAKLLLGDNRLSLIEALTPLTNFDKLQKSFQEVQGIVVSQNIANYIVDLLTESRNSESYMALSPRAGLDLVRAAKAWTYIEGRQAVEPEDIQAVAKPVLGHRLVSTYESSGQFEKELTIKLINTVDVY